MKIVHCLGWYFPDSVGGTEVYVSQLARALRERNAQVVVMAPRDGLREERYEHEGITVQRYPVVLERDRKQSRGRVAHTGFERFVSLLAVEQADVFHLHSSSYGSNLHHARAARQLGLRTFTTVHVPEFVCPRGTMMRMGEEACDGVLDPVQCVRCVLHARGVPRGAANALAPMLRRVPGVLPVPPGRVGSALAIAGDVTGRHAALLELAEQCDAVIAVCEWLRDTLVRNGVPPAKVACMRQGVDAPRRPLQALRRPSPAAPLRIAYFGRSSVVKGLDTLTAAIESLPASLPVQLDAYAIANGPDEHAQLTALHAAALRDPRIRARSPVAPGEVAETMRQYDVIAVPSRWMETGPLVAAEALVSGVPVLGSDLGGLRELVQSGVNGFLEPADDVERWRTRIEQLALGELALGDGSIATHVPTVGDVADAMLALYDT